MEQNGASGWRLTIPAGGADRYRLAQLDDYSSLARSRFPWRAPLSLTLRAWVSAPNLPGTWGFGLWNDPFSLSFGFGGGARRLPALPNAAWFFFASTPNYLSLREDLPAQGFLAASFRSMRLPAPLLGLGALGLPLLALPGAGKLARRIARRMVQQDAAQVYVNPCEWHTYSVIWGERQLSLRVDEETVLTTACTPVGRLGMVLWIDNQYAAFTPDGRLSWGLLPNPEPAWLEVDQIACKTELV